MASYYTRGSVTALPYMILEVSWDSLGALSFELLRIHGHSSWLMCEVALSVISLNNGWGRTDR
jgi:hypothetical protein